MPNPTFENLNQHRKEEIISVVLQEFEDRSLNQVKVAELIKRLGISRGAFYKYFEDLDDLYLYLQSYFSEIIHRDIMNCIMENQQRLFYGIERYLKRVAEMNRNSDYWRGIKLLVLGSKTSYSMETIDMEESPMIRAWFSLLDKNNLHMNSGEEKISFLFFSMELVMDLLSSFLLNDWESERLLKEYNFRVAWLSHGLIK
ncbi:TetR family transcriptional regulator [Enterococcus sp. LJL51]|uniref:TetR family transcriptional regulator n=1 Tax=Enterococcus sp. LJL51 TaxID=3416656 RepID=UPI003CF973AF